MKAKRILRVTKDGETKDLSYSLMDGETLERDRRDFLLAGFDVEVIEPDPFADLDVPFTDQERIR